MDPITITYYGPRFYCNRVYMAADLMGPSLEKAFGTYFHNPHLLTVLPEPSQKISTSHRKRAS